jgi:pimeloyl-ACP methyl ester carboxylesterase
MRDKGAVRSWWLRTSAKSSRSWALVIVVLAVSACADVDSALRPQVGEVVETVVSNGFSLVVVAKGVPPESGRSETVWVFIEGDGLPWMTPSIPSIDPTPRHPVALELFRETRGPALYIGRPCYWGGSLDKPCRPYYWTYGRFAPEIVESMAGAIETIARRFPYQQFLLVGYSGGGVLAALLAERTPNALGVVAVAAPLDHEIWTSRLGISPLAGSMNPAASAASANERIPRLLVFGSRDDVVRPSDAGAYASFPNTSTKVVWGADHACCWQEWWREQSEQILADWRR